MLFSEIVSIRLWKHSPFCLRLSQYDWGNTHHSVWDSQPSVEPLEGWQCRNGTLCYKTDQCQFLLKTDNYVQTVFIYIFGQFLQVHFLICIHSQTLLSQILQDIPVYMYIRGFRNRGFRLLTNFDNFIVFQMSIFKT